MKGQSFVGTVYFFFFLFHWSHRLLLCLLKGNPSAHPLREFSKGKTSKTMRSRKSSYELMAAAYITFRCTWMEHFNARPCVDSLVPTTEPFVQHMGAGWVGILPFCTPGKGRKWVKGVRMFFFPPIHKCGLSYATKTMTCMALDVRQRQGRGETDIYVMGRFFFFKKHKMCRSDVIHAGHIFHFSWDLAL